jgi:serine/threonine protein kinase/tetratricopeptide (TPR) repeat protein
MTQTRWQTVKSLFFDAIALNGAEREAFLRDLAEADKDASAQLRTLLADRLDTGPDLRQPCWIIAEPSAPEPSPPEHAFQPGRRLADRFEIRGFLGSGGLGEVYRAFDDQRQMFVAIKTLRPGMTSDPAALSLLRNELNTAQVVTHPNVCRVFDIHFSPSDESTTFFTMELLDGETMASYVASQGPLSLDHARELVPQVLDGLGAIHERGIVHRDLKTTNIMLTDGGLRVVLLDFGLAREMKAAGDLATTLAANECAGTPAYMAPEQLRGQPASVTSDIYALGVVLFEIMTGRRPFEGATPLEAAARRLHENAPSPRRYAPKLDRRWEYTIVRCLKAEPATRPQSVAEVRRLLTRDPPLMWRSRRAFLLGGAATAAAIGAAILRPPGLMRGPASIGIFDLVNRTGDPGLDYLTSGTTLEIVRRLSGSQGLNIVRMYGRDTAKASLGEEGLYIDGDLSGTRQQLKWDLRLRNSSSGKTVWSGSVDQSQGQDAAVVQDRIASAIASHLKPMQPLLVRVSDRTGKSSSGNGLALDYYMRGRSLLEDASPAGVRAAIQSIKKALEIDPDFALAWSALADANLGLMAYVTGRSLPLLEEAKASANRAIAIDPELAEAHAALGAIHQQELDWESAEKSYQEALRLKPFFPRAHRWYAGFVLQFGRFAAVVEHSRIALKQDPFDQMGPMAIGFYFLFSDRPKDAIDLMEPFVEGRYVDGTRYNLGQAYARMAQSERGDARDNWLKKALGQAELLKNIETRQKTERPWLSDKLLALTHTIAGKAAEAATHVSRLLEDMQNARLTPADVAWTYAIERDFGTAINLLERAFAESPNGLVYIKVNPFLENLRGQPRFERLIRDLRL